MRQEPDFFGDVELDLVFMARRLSDALKLESSFTDAGLDYLVETGKYSGGFLFRRDLDGAFFYVSPADKVKALQVVKEIGLKPYAENSD